MLTLTSLGGAGTVTGSKHLLTTGKTRILVDCGLFQGLKNLRELNWERLPVDARQIDAVVLTHAHLDHCGHLPRLMLDGFHGRVHCTSATRDVAELILKDSGHLQEKDAEYANRKGFSKHQPARPLYTEHDAERTMSLFAPAPWHREIELPGQAKLYFSRAGHILGAACAQIDIAGKRVVFSGDLGRYDDALLAPPEAVEDADVVVIESTYGNRLHAGDDPAEALAEVIERTARRGGTVVIPAFAVGRAQQLLYYLFRLKQAGRLAQVPVYLDSPMAINAGALYPRHNADHRLDADTCEGIARMVTSVREVEESKALSASRWPKVIISASGMATGGRVLHHIAAFAHDHRNTLLFSGFQAAGTRGRKLLDGDRTTRMFGQEYAVNAEVVELSMLSAHADSNELMRWLSGFRRPPEQVFIVHGEDRAADALRLRIKHELGWKATVSLQYRSYPL